jgi:hypothetical protein
LATISWVSLSVVVGAFTHVAWDSLTHGSGYLVSHSSILQQSVFSMLGKEFRLFNVLQHASTLLGVTVLVVVYVCWLRVTTRASSVPTAGGDAWRYCLLAFLAFASLVTAGVLSYFASATTAGGSRVATFVFRMVIDSTAIFAILLSTAALVLPRATRDT